ncbi:Ff.00g054620.m01.CDS01 [Fusarium sp. VM40]|nr:Ff.00g054620.m01.CDS01 [Fusarium sp. VM40]
MADKIPEPTVDQAVKDQAVKDQAVKDQAVKDQAVKDQAVKDQAVADQQAVRDKMSLREIFDLMKEDPEGNTLNALGYDGVLRRFDPERNVLDAVGLNPTQVREYWEGLTIPDRFLIADGRNVSHWDMFHPAAESIPKKFTAEDRARVQAHNEELERRGVTCCVPDKSADDDKSKAE